jgi:hypothetical protein
VKDPESDPEPDPEPDPYLVVMDPDPEGPKTHKNDPDPQHCFQEKKALQSLLHFGNFFYFPTFTQKINQWSCLVSAV